MSFDAIVVGGGAAGLFCAISAGRRGRRVLVLEHNAEAGRKILISGGGRCNFTNTGTSAENFISQNPHFCKSALSRYTPADFVSLVRKYRIPFYEKKLGQLFCRESSRPIVDMLLAECRKAHVDVKTSCSVDTVGHDCREYVLATSHGIFRSPKLVIACGGLSFPKVGATDLGYRVARQFGLKIVVTRPSLVAMTLKGGGYPDLAGVSVDTTVNTGSQSFRENILFTHRGLSGPAILQISNYWKPGIPISVDLSPDADVSGLALEHLDSRQSLGNFLASVVPARLARRLAVDIGADRPLADVKKKDLEALARSINDWKVEFADTEGYGRAEVTLGGVSTAELSSQTMEAKRRPGLYFIGEVVDVTGWLGGYNFQWAWASGFAAGNSI
jgi:predicted Rossmann fold flavoprotein